MAQSAEIDKELAAKLGITVAELDAFVEGARLYGDHLAWKLPAR